MLAGCAGKLNPNTLASGLDDYPRSSSPGPEERHADLVAWLAAASRALGRVATALGDAEGAAPHQQREAALLRSLEDVHWDDVDGAYYDVGMHSELGAFRDLAVIRCASARDQHDGVDFAVAPEQLQQGGAGLCPSHHPRYLWPVGDGAGNILMRPTYVESDADRSVQFVRRVGVVNIFPLLLRLLPPDSPRLPRMLDLLADEDKLWSRHGMRSLGKIDRFYQRPNAPGCATSNRAPQCSSSSPSAYGLAAGTRRTGAGTCGCRSTTSPCSRCSTTPTARRRRPRQPSARRNSTPSCGTSAISFAAHVFAADAFGQLCRTNLLKTVLGSYHKTGFFWEQYDDRSGDGLRSHPFTGWTALVVNIMGERFD